MRKKVAIGFLLLANFVLLAHTVLPHHHHEDETVCFLFHSCNENKGCDHKGYEACSLINVFIKQQTEQNNLKNDLHSQVLSFIFPNNHINFRQFAAFPFEQIPFLRSVYSSIVLQSCGLRAPPALYR